MPNTDPTPSARDLTIAHLAAEVIVKSSNTSPAEKRAARSLIRKSNRTAAPAIAAPKFPFHFGDPIEVEDGLKSYSATFEARFGTAEAIVQPTIAGSKTRIVKLSQIKSAI